MAAGNITAKEAETKLKDAQEAIKVRQAAQHEDYLDLAKAWDRQETLIAEGMVTFEEAVSEYEQAKQQILSGAGVYANAGQAYQEATEKFQAAIRAGTMSHAEAFTRLSSIEMEAYAQEFAKAEQLYAQEAVQASLAAMVFRGEITQEEADLKLEAYQADLLAKKDFDKQEKKVMSKEDQKQKQQELEKKQQAQKEQSAQEKKKGK